MQTMSALNPTDPNNGSSTKRKSETSSEQTAIASDSRSQGSKPHQKIMLNPVQSDMTYSSSPRTGTPKPEAYWSASPRTRRKLMTYGKKGTRANDNRRTSDLFGSVIARRQKRKDRRERRVRFSEPLFSHIPDVQINESTPDSATPVSLPPQQAMYVLATLFEQTT